MIDRWLLNCKHHRIHSSLECQNPVAFAAGCVLSAMVAPPEHSRFPEPRFSHSPRTKDRVMEDGQAVALRLAGSLATAVAWDVAELKTKAAPQRQKPIIVLNGISKFTVNVQLNLAFVCGPGCHNVHLLALLEVFD